MATDTRHINATMIPSVRFIVDLIRFIVRVTEGASIIRQPGIMKWNLVRFLLIGLIVFAMVSTSTAHEIPADVTIHLFLKPEGQKLRMIVRVPMAALRDADFPKRGPQGYLDLAQADFA